MIFLSVEYNCNSSPTLKFQLFHKPICSWSSNEKVTDGDKFDIRMIMLPECRVADGRPSYLFPCKVVQSVWDDHNKYETILSLYAGSHMRSPKVYPPPLLANNPPLEHPTRPAVDIDIEYVHGVVHGNTFSFSEKHDGRGLYALPSLLNHSCLPSAFRTHLGDAVVVRAGRDMKKGEEVTVGYIDPSVPYDERRFRLMRSWQFKCTCMLCEADSKDDIKAREKRKDIVKALIQMLGILPSITDRVHLRRLAAEAKKHCDDMKKTYNTAHSALTGGVKYELRSALELCAFVVERHGRIIGDTDVCVQAMNLRMDSLDYGGTKVIDRKMFGPVSGARCQKTFFPVDCSRLAVEHSRTISTILQIVQAFEYFHLPERAQRWLDAALHSTSSVRIEFCF